MNTHGGEKRRKIDHSLLLFACVLVCFVGYIISIQQALVGAWAVRASKLWSLPASHGHLRPPYWLVLLCFCCVSVSAWLSPSPIYRDIHIINHSLVSYRIVTLKDYDSSFLLYFFSCALVIVVQGFCAVWDIISLVISNKANRVFGLVVWFSLRVREVASSILATPRALLFSCFSSAIAAFLLTLLPCFSLCCNSLFFLTIRAGATEFHRKISKQISFGSTEVHQKSANLQRRSSTITRISIFVPTYCDPYTAHILLATTNVTTTYLLQDGISHLITPVACSIQPAAESAKSLHSILLCNNCFFRTNLSRRNLWASWNASPHLALTLPTLLFGWQWWHHPF